MARRRPGGNFGNFGAESFSKQPKPEVYKVKPIKAEFGGSAPDSLYSSNRESSWTRWRKGWELAVADGARKSFNYPFTYEVPFPPSITPIGARQPVAFFAYPNKPGILTQEKTNFLELAGLSDDITSLIDEFSGLANVTSKTPKTISEFNPPETPQGPINTTSLGMALGALIPENAIIVDESVTTGREFFYQTSGSHPHTWLNNCGGSIGFGMPVAIGAAIACPNQKIISLEGDGSAMYTVQSLWTMARENLDIVILIFANQSYKILQGELKNVGVTNPGKSAIEMLSLRNPELDWVSISRGMGVDAVKVDNIEDLVKYFKHGIKENGPFLIEVLI